MDASETSGNPVEVQNMSQIVTLNGPNKHRKLDLRFSNGKHGEDTSGGV